MTEYIWIIGASSGIGAALAKLYASKGHNVAISARSSAGLAKVAKDMNTSALAVELDVTDTTSINAAKDKILASWPKIDRVIFMAGIYEPMSFGQIDLDFARKTIDINLMGAINTIEALLPNLIAFNSQLAICASIAGFVGLPNSQPYSATKAALINLTQSLKIEYGSKIDVRLINPGFVKTRLTEKNNFPMPGIISSEKAAKIIARKLSGRSFSATTAISFGLFLRITPLCLLCKLF